LTGAGMSVALIERKLIGGTCVNTGCTPTKTLIASAYAAQMARRASDYGLTIGEAVGVDMKRVTRHFGKRILVGTRPMTRVARAIEKGETQVLKVIVDADTQEILGAAILGVGGDEVVHGILAFGDCFADDFFRTAEAIDRSGI